MQWEGESGRRREEEEAGGKDHNKDGHSND